MSAPQKSVTIAALSSTVYDNGRRGMPRPGCDCVQCFGYCLVDKDKAARDQSELATGVSKPRHSGPLVLE